MKESAHHFVEKKKPIHGPEVWEILFCDNLSGAHLNADVKDTFAHHGKVLLCYFPTN